MLWFGHWGVKSFMIQHIVKFNQSLPDEVLLISIAYKATRLLRISQQCIVKNCFNAYIC